MLIIVVCFLVIVMALRAKARASSQRDSSDGDSIKVNTLSHNTSRRLVNAWDPEINRKAKQLYEPLID